MGDYIGFTGLGSKLFQGEVYMGDYVGERYWALKGDTRSLDYSS